MNRTNPVIEPHKQTDILHTQAEKPFLNKSECFFTLSSYSENQTKIPSNYIHDFQQVPVNLPPSHSHWSSSLAQVRTHRPGARLSCLLRSFHAAGRGHCRRAGMGRGCTIFAFFFWVLLKWVVTMSITNYYYAGSFPHKKISKKNLILEQYFKC